MNIYGPGLEPRMLHQIFFQLTPADAPYLEKLAKLLKHKAQSKVSTTVPDSEQVPVMKLHHYYPGSKFIATTSEDFMRKVVGDPSASLADFAGSMVDFQGC